MCPYLTKFTATAWSINKIIPVSIGLETTTEVLADDSNAGKGESKMYVLKDLYQVQETWIFFYLIQYNELITVEL